MYYYIVNPAAGSGAAAPLQDKLRAELKALGIGGEFVTTTGSGDASKLAAQAQAKGYTTVVAVGGDETLNEVINGVTSETVAIGVIPLGHANHIAAQLGILSWQQACRVLAARRLSEYALIAAGHDFFLSTLSLGFENELPEVHDQPARGLGATVTRVREGLRRAANFEPIPTTIDVDDTFKVRAKVFSLAITNQKFIDPLAMNELAVSLIDRPGKRELSSLFWKRRHSSQFGELASTYFHAHSLRISTEPEVNVAIDGKFIGRTPITIRLTDRRIRFIVEKLETT